MQWCAPQGSQSLLFWVWVFFFRLVSLSACLLSFFLGYFYSFPGLHFLLCILFLIPDFISTIWMLSKIVSWRVGVLASGHSWSQQPPWWLPTVSHSSTSCAASVAASKCQWHHPGKEQLASWGRTGRLQASHNEQNLIYPFGRQEKEQAVPLNLPDCSLVTGQVFFATWRTGWFPSCSHTFLLQLLNCSMLGNPSSWLPAQAAWSTLLRWFSQQHCGRTSTLLWAEPCAEPQPSPACRPINISQGKYRAGIASFDRATIDSLFSVTFCRHLRNSPWSGGYQQTTVQPHWVVIYLAATFQEKAEITNLHGWIPVFTMLSILPMPPKTQLLPHQMWVFCLTQKPKCGWVWLAELWWLQYSAAHVLSASRPWHRYTGQKKDWKKISCCPQKLCSGVPRPAELALCIDESPNPRKM